MNNNETDLRKSVLSYLGHMGHWSIIESHATSTGVPDLAYCIDGVEGWLELKFARKDRMPKIRPAQRRWIAKHWKAGGRPLVLFQIQDQYGLIEGRHINRLYDEAKNKTVWFELAHRVWEEHPNWIDLINELTLRREDNE